MLHVQGPGYILNCWHVLQHPGDCLSIKRLGSSCPLGGPGLGLFIIARVVRDGVLLLIIAQGQFQCALHSMCIQHNAMAESRHALGGPELYQSCISQWSWTCIQGSCISFAEPSPCQSRSILAVVLLERFAAAAAVAAAVASAAAVAHCIGAQLV